MPTDKVRVVFETIGRLTATWNDVETLWYLIYTCLLHEAPQNKADAVFHAHITGASQRQLIMALVDVALPENSAWNKLRARAAQLHTLTNDLSGLRNAVIHGLYMLDPLNSRIGIRVAPGINPLKPNRLSGISKELDEELAALLSRIETLTAQLDEFRVRLIWEYLPEDQRPVPLPDSVPEPLRQRLLATHPELRGPPINAQSETPVAASPRSRQRRPASQQKSQQERRPSSAQRRAAALQKRNPSGHED